MLIGGFGFHLRDGFHFTLKNEEPLVIKINPTVLEKRGDRREI